MELMKLYSSANSSIVTEALANRQNVSTIVQPNLCLFGSTTPERMFHGGINRAQLVDGFMGRMLSFRPECDDIPENEEANCTAGVPFEIVATLKSWWDFTPGTGNLSSFSPDPIIAEYTPEARQRYRRYRDEIQGKHKTDDEISRAIWSKAKEKVSKLALIHAALQGVPRDDIEITIESMEWAIAVCNYGNRVLLVGSESMVESKLQENMRTVKRKIVDGITLRDLKRRCRGVGEDRNFRAAMDALEEDGEAWIETVPAGPNGGRPSVVVHLGTKPDQHENLCQNPGNLASIVQ